MLLPCIDSTPPLPPLPHQILTSSPPMFSAPVGNPAQSPALFQNILKFCTFLPKFSNVLPFFWPFLTYFALFLPFLGKITWMPLPSRIGPDQIQGVIVPLLTYNSRKNVSFVNKVRKKSFETAKSSLCTNWCGGL